MSLVGSASQETASLKATPARHTQRPPGQWRKALRWDWMSAALTATIAGGATARLVGGSWGLPLDLNSDEWVIVRGALDMAKRHSFEPGYFFRPDHLEMQLSNLAYLAYSYTFHGTSPETLYATFPAPFILISRSITACFGIAMIVLAYLIGKRFARPVGVLAAFVVAFYPPFVNHSHFASPDVPLSLALMVVILGCMRYLTSPSWGNLLLSCLAVSAAIAIKYPGALGSLMIGVTVIISGVQARAWGRILLHGAAAIAAVVGFLFVISPVLFTNAHETLSTMVDQGGDTHAGADGLSWSGNMAFYAAGLATSAGVILLVCFALGVLWSIRLRLVQSIPLWLGAVVWVLLSRVPSHWERWALPMDLTPLLIAPIGVYYSFLYLREKRANSSAGAARWLPWGAVGLAVVMAANLVAGSVAASATLVAKDTRTFAPRLAARGVTASNTISEGYTPLFLGAKKIFTAFDVTGGRLVLSSHDKEHSGIRYVVLSSDMYARYLTDPKYGVEQRFYTEMDKQFPLLTSYVPVQQTHSVLELASIWGSLSYVADIARGGFSGPTIKLYEIPADRR